MELCSKQNFLVILSKREFWSGLLDMEMPLRIPCHTRKNHYRFLAKQMFKSFISPKNKLHQNQAQLSLQVVQKYKRKEPRAKSADSIYEIN